VKSSSACIFILAILASLSGCVVAESSAGDKGTQPAPPSPQPTFTVTGDEPTSKPTQPDYINEVYGFKLTYPEGWILEEESRAVILKYAAMHLTINYARAGEDIGPGLFGRTGIGAGDFIYRGKVRCLGDVIPVQRLELEGKHKALFFNGTEMIEAGDLRFMIVLEDSTLEYADVDIPERVQQEAISIVGTLVRIDEATACQEQGGRWEVLGLGGPGCNLPTKDGGMRCADNSECEGLCLAQHEEILVEDEQGVLVPDSERIAEINAREGDLDGVCSLWESDFGCSVVVESGKLREICVD
jgi:hypothetical protein